jgi:hypothetical protein
MAAPARLRVLWVRSAAPAHTGSLVSIARPIARLDPRRSVESKIPEALAIDRGARQCLHRHLLAGAAGVKPLLIELYLACSRMYSPIWVITIR